MTTSIVTGLNKRFTSVLLVAVLASVSAIKPAHAQEQTDTMHDDTHMDHSTMMDMAQESKSDSTDHMTRDMDATSDTTMDTQADTKSSHDMGSMSGMDGIHDMNGMSEGAMQGGSAPADARDPHAYAEGYGFGDVPRPRFADEHNFGSVLMDRLEAVRTSDDTFAAYDLQAWYGRDYNRVVFKSEGEVNNGELEEASTELLWGHAITAFWDSQLGMRYDSGEGPDRAWLGFGVQGLAPYWFEVDAAAYVGEAGRTALSLEAEYEVLLTQRLILQPRFEAEIYGKDDAERGIGSGLSELNIGLRLRYELRREFAPYVGVEWAGKFGSTADYARDAGLDTKETRAVAGIRFWF